jgi:tRNA threonylcarbamoyladenosine biosynthesis protein TsaE
MQSPRQLVSETMTSSEAETEAIGTALAAELRGGEAVLLHGDLGAGKTAFVRGLARGLQADPSEVASPTFVLLTRYAGRLSLHHADLYRLNGGGDDLELGLDELPGEDGVLAVEWAERLSHRPWPRCIEVTLEHAGDDQRRVRVERAER